MTAKSSSGHCLYTILLALQPSESLGDQRDQFVMKLIAWVVLRPQ